MRLATKYQIETVRKRVVEILHDSWPRTYEQWRRFESEISVVREIHGDRLDHLVDGKSFDERIPEPAAAIRFARDFDVPSILPFAFYTLAGISQSNDWDVARKADSRKRSLAAAVMERTARWSHLDIVDYRTFVKCREALTMDIFSIIEKFGRLEKVLANTLGEYCVGHAESACHARVGVVFDAWHSHGPLEEEDKINAAKLPDPLGLLEDLGNTSSTWQACWGCRDGMREYIKDTQIAVWRSIDMLKQCV